MPMEALWRWFREDVTDSHCHTCPKDFRAQVEDFRNAVNLDLWAVTDGRWAKDSPDLDEEKRRMPK